MTADSNIIILNQPEQNDPVAKLSREFACKLFGWNFKLKSEIGMSLIIMRWAIYEVFSNIPVKGKFIPLMLQAVGAIIISAAIADVAQYMIEKEVFMTK